MNDLGGSPWAQAGWGGEVPVNGEPGDATGPALPRGRMIMRRVPGRLGGKVYVHVPRSWRPGGRVLVAVHGISRNAREQARLFAPWAERHGFAILAPLFARDRYRDYQRLGLEKGGRRADEFLNAALDAFAQWTGAPLSEVSLFGFSGGAQFAHRYVMFHPGRVRAVVLGAAGWYTWPDAAQPFPLGLADLPALGGTGPEQWLGLPTLVVVGSHDTTRDAALRQTPHIDATQGPHRLERARRFVAALREAAARHGIESRAEFALLYGVGHEFGESMSHGGLAEQALPFLGLSAPPVRGDRP